MFLVTSASLCLQQLVSPDTKESETWSILAAAVQMGAMGTVACMLQDLVAVLVITAAGHRNFTDESGHSFDMFGKFVS